uniref:Uncharacterized protein n=1 Tax=Micrurus corallinus TaxID=54390 RepID=A0A2D4GU95_MICCO
MCVRNPIQASPAISINDFSPLLRFPDRHLYAARLPLLIVLLPVAEPALVLDVPNGTDFLIGAKNPFWGQDGVILFGFLLYLNLLICAGRSLIVFLLMLVKGPRARNDPAWKHFDLVCNTIYLFLKTRSCSSLLKYAFPYYIALPKNALSFAHSYIAFLQENCTMYIFVKFYSLFPFLCPYFYFQGGSFQEFFVSP